MKLQTLVLTGILLTYPLSSPALADGPGFAVDVFPAGETFPRNSEGSVIELSGGRLLLAATRFYGGTADAAGADIVGRTSADGGKTWTEPVVLQKNIGRRNVMSASLIRVTGPSKSDTNASEKKTAGPIGLFYLLKNGDADLNVYLRISTDEGRSFGDPVRVTSRPGYHVMNNDRVVRLSTGRLLCPVAFTPDSRKTNHYTSLCFICDDAGQTWRAGINRVDAPKRGAMEPEVIEKQNGDLLMLVRTQLGRNLAAISNDGGDTWSEPKPFGPPAPEAPSTLRKIPSTGDWLLIFNDNVQPGHHHSGRRTPLSAAVSRDEGRTWTHKRNLENRDDQTYAYTSLIFNRSRAVMTYYVRDEATARLSLRFRSVPVAWFYE